MKKLLIVLFVSLFAGQLGSISVAPGVTLYLHDFVVVAILGYAILTGAIKRSMAGFHPAKPVMAFVCAHRNTNIAFPRICPVINTSNRWV